MIQNSQYLRYYLPKFELLFCMIILLYKIMNSYGGFG